jgi:AraC-like DNA-binding protein
MIALTACRQSITIQMGDHVAQGSALIAGARARHMRAEGVQLVIIQLNPFHHRYRSFRHLHTAVSLNRDRFSRFDAELDAAYKGELSLNEAQLLYRGVVMEVANDLPIMKPLDARVQETMRLLHDNPRVTLNELASHCDLSYDRMSHLFIDELGISIRSFQLWVKLHRALTGVRYGQSLVELARVAGFSDAAHLSRVYKQVYGAPPSYFYYSGNLKLIASFAGEVPGALPAIAAKLPVASEQNTTDLMLG